MCSSVATLRRLRGSSTIVALHSKLGVSDSRCGKAGRQILPLSITLG